MKVKDKITITNEDNMELMARYPDNYFDLAIVDPPYGLGKRTTDGGSKRNTQTKFMEDIRRTNWDDSTPTREYFDELKRVSKNQIVWGGNYFELHSYRTFVIWDKMTYVPTMSQVEMAVTSFDSPARLVKINSNQSDRIHPTQKPIQLYKWILQNYASEGDLILDTHVGSGSIRIACDKGGFNFTGFEIDTDYWKAQEKRFSDFKRQMRLF